VKMMDRIAGWAEMERHLIDKHGHDGSEIDDLDADTARLVHRMDHSEGRFEVGQVHVHE